MQIVIDISEDDYKKVQDGRASVSMMLKAIRNGTLLPKGHGRLIDADEIQFENTEFETYGDYCIAFDAIDEAPTIIPADTECK